MHTPIARRLPSRILMLLVTGALFASGANEESSSLVVGIMPAVDSAPLIVADVEGYFAEEGVEVTLELFRDQLYREAALQSGEIDASVTDLVNAIRSIDGGARVVTSTQGVFSIVTSAASGIDTPAAWPRAPQKVPIGSLEDSIINFVAREMLAEQGIDPDQLEIVPVMQIPLRVEMVVAGEVDAVVLPEPLTRLAVAGGASELVRSTVLPWTPGVIVATGSALARKGAALGALLRAYDRAVDALSSNPDRYRAAIAQAAGFPQAVVERMVLPDYQPAALPTSGQIEIVAEWMIDRGLLSGMPERSEIVAELAR